MPTRFSREIKQLSPIAIPAVLSQLAQMAMGVIDTIMAGHYSNDALAAIAIGTSLLHPIIVFFLGLFLAFNPVVAHLNGKEAWDKISTHFRLSIVLAVIFSPIAIIILFNAQFVLAMLGVDRQVAELATGYLHATVWGMPGLLIFLALRFCNEGLFSTTAIMTATVVSIPFNIGLNYWFMYGGYGINEMGAVGVGYATSLVWSLMCVGLWFYTAIAKKYQHLKIFKSIELPTWSETREILKLGLPMAVTLGFEITMFAAVSLMIARYPAEIIGAHQIAFNITAIFFMIPLGISQAITARVGYFSGRSDPEAVRIAGYSGIGVAVGFSVFTAATMILIPASLVGFYSQDQQVMDIAIGLLFFAAVFQLSDAAQVSTAGALRGVKDTKMPMVLTAVSYWVVGFPCGFILAEYYDMKVNGYWIGLIAGLSSAALLLLYRWIKLVPKPSE